MKFLTSQSGRLRRALVEPHRVFAAAAIDNVPATIDGLDVIPARTRAHNVYARIFGGRDAGTAHPGTKLPGGDVVGLAATDWYIGATETVKHVAAIFVEEPVVAVANAVGGHFRGIAEETAGRIFVPVGAHASVHNVRAAAGVHEVSAAPSVNLIAPLVPLRWSSVTVP